MPTVYFSNGKTAEVTNVHIRKIMTFHIPPASLEIFDDALAYQETLQFKEGGELYVLTEVQLDSRGTAVFQTSQD